MTRRLGGFRRRGFPALASLSLVSALACSGAITGCGGDDNGGGGGSNQEDAGGDAGDGGLLDASKDAGKAGDAAIDATSEASTSIDAGVDSGTTGPDAEGSEEAGPDSSMTTTPEAGTDAGPDSSTGGGGSDGGKEAGIVDSGPDSTLGSIDSGIDSSIADAHSGVDASDAGNPAVASFPTSTITLTGANCGGTATPTNFIVTNTGGGTLTVNASIPGSVFSVTPTSTTVAAGQQGTFAIHAAIPGSATAGTPLTGNLNITTSDTTHAPASIPLSATPTGITLAWTPTSADFGIAPNGQQDTPINLTLTNTGNAPATGLTLGTPTDPQFSLGTPDGTTVAANGGVVHVQAGFLPNTTTNSSATSSITVTGAVCGANSVTSLAFSGQGGTGHVTGWPSATVDFGPAPCGGAPPANQPFTLANSGDVDVTIVNATTGATDPAYTTDAIGKTIPHGGTLVVNLIAPGIPGTSAVPGSYAGTLTFTTNPPGLGNAVAVTEEAQGAILAFDTSQQPNFGLFNQVNTGSFSTQNFNVVNSGNAPAQVSILLSTPFSVANSTFTVGATPFSNSVTYSPTQPVSSQEQLTMQTNDVLCQPLPTTAPSISLIGQGEGGSVSVSDTSLAFSANCGSQADPKTFTIFDTAGNQPFNWTLAGTDGGAIDTTFYNVSPTSGTATPDTPSVVTVTPVAIEQFPPSTAPATFAMTLNIQTDVPGDLGHQVALSETPLGDIISLVPATSPIDFGPTPVGTTSQSQSLTFQNAANPGTPNATLTFAATDSTDFDVLNSPLGIPLGGSSNINVEFVSPAVFPDAGNGEFTSNLTFTTTDPICAPLPTADINTPRNGTFPIQGLATQAGPSIQPAAVNFGLVNCGTAAPFQNITITNTGNQDFNINTIGLNSLPGELSDSLYTIALSGHLVVAGTGSQTITVTPTAIPTEVDTVPNFSQFSEAILIVTDANTSPNSFTVNLNEGAQGAIVTAPPQLGTLNWIFGTVAVGQQSSFTPSIENTGNADLLVQLVNDTTSNSVYSLSQEPTDIPAEVNNAPTRRTIVANFRPTSPGTTSPENAHLSFGAVAPGQIPSVLCAPLPASWQAATVAGAISLTGTSSGSSGP